MEQDGRPLPPEEHPMNLLLKGRSEIRAVCEFRRDQGPLALEITGTCIQWGQAMSAIFVIHDVSERKRVEEELRTLNKELETFSYSVSHDLRAPLRRIAGFSEALLQDYEDKLGDSGKNFLQRVKAGTQEMALLIDDLLTLSRVTRSDMNKEDIRLSGLVRAIASELQATNPERPVNFVIQEDVTVQGDYRLLRIVFENLLGNAWKFTSKHSQALIKFGSLFNQEGKPVYFVQDDGAGFDMAYAHKLFGPFQRLHGPSEFPGTGIGLATVQRIIHRSGGRIWAEGAVEKGATIYFTL